MLLLDFISVNSKDKIIVFYDTDIKRPDNHKTFDANKCVYCCRACEFHFRRSSNIIDRGWNN